jgi:hypothetical protein
MTQKDQIIKTFRFEIERRSVDFGGGWNLHFIERDAENGEEIEIGGGVESILIGALRIRAMLPFDGAFICCVRVARFTLILGPWRGLTVAVLRHMFRNRVFPRISPTLFPQLDVEAASRALDRDSFAVGLKIPQSLTKNIIEFGAQSKLVQEAHWDCAEINRIAHDTGIAEVVKRYLGVEPSTTLFWTLLNTSGEATYPETFHYDGGDFKTVCVCFYRG